MSKWQPIGIVEKISNLPTIPTTISAVLHEMADSNSSAIELAKLISSDQSLAGGILRVVNSAYYGFPRQIGSLTEAIVILGYKEIRSIVLSATAFRFFYNSSKYLDRTKLWKHTLACAITAETLSRKFHIEKGSPFEAGLLHDIGKVVFDYLDPELFQEAVKEARAQELPLYKVEPHYFGIDHSEVGTLLANHWNLPDTIVQSILYHHKVEKTPPKFITLTCLVTLSNALTYSIEMGDSVGQTIPELPPMVFETLNIQETIFKDFNEELHTIVEKGIEAFESF